MLMHRITKKVEVNQMLESLHFKCLIDPIHAIFMFWLHLKVKLWLSLPIHSDRGLGLLAKKRLQIGNCP